jgi:hypothetical protein
MNLKREGVLIALFIVFLLSFTSAEVNTSSVDSFSKSYDCLNKKVEERGVSSMNIEELAFSLMALGYNADKQKSMYDELESKADTSSSGKKCWPKGACNLKDTSLVSIAYQYIGQDTDNINSWLLNKTISSPDLTWYLQIDSAEKTECSLIYKNETRKISISEDKKISGTPGVCFRLAQNNYWLEIVPTCYSMDIEITCTSDFLTALVYKGKTDGIYYVSDLTNTASAGGKIKEKVDSKCFSLSRICDYEGSLWASLALTKQGSFQSKEHLPYLMAFSSANSRIFPSPFLYAITGFDEYFSDISDKQKLEGYWQISTSGKRYYDTAMALYSLYGRATEQSQKAIDYLLSPSVQQEGCWQNSIRDTAFILFASSPKSPAKGNTLGTKTSCSSFSNYSCLSLEECKDAGGSSLNNFYCYGGAVCCDKKILEKPCSEKDGIRCSASQSCTGTTVSSSDSSYCCIEGECEDKPATPTPSETCEEVSSDYKCKSQCTDSETEVESLTCPEYGVCCSSKQKEKSIWWIWLLILLIILLILAIIFRYQLKILWFKIKGDVKKSDEGYKPRPTSFMPPFMPGAGQNAPRRIIPGQIAPPMRPLQRPPMRPFPKERELSDTMQKLRDLSKK